MKTVSHTIATPFKAGDSFEIIAVHIINGVPQLSADTIISGQIKDVRGTVIHTFIPTEISVNLTYGLIMIRVDDSLTSEWPECQAEIKLRFETADSRSYSANRIRIYIERL